MGDNQTIFLGNMEECVKVFEMLVYVFRKKLGHHLCKPWWRWNRGWRYRAWFSRTHKGHFLDQKVRHSICSVWKALWMLFCICLKDESRFAKILTSCQILKISLPNEVIEVDPFCLGLDIWSIEGRCSRPCNWSQGVELLIQFMVSCWHKMLDNSKEIGSN